MLLKILAYVDLIWYTCVHIVRLLGLATHLNRVQNLKLLSGDGASTLHRKHKPTDARTPVTILRPMKGADEHLYECLRSGFQQNYSNFEIILCVDSENDPATAIGRQLLDEFPEVDARILVGADSYGPNPKINNLAKGYRSAKYDLLWVLDANVWVHADTLSRSVNHFTPGISLVHHLPLTVSFGRGLGEKMEEMYMSTAHALFYTGINDVGIAACVMGKSNLYHRSELDKAVSASMGAGLQHFAKYMAEDHLIAEALWAAGGRTSMAPDAAVQPLSSDLSLDEFVSRRVRWVRLRKYMVTAATLVEPSTDSFFAGFMGVMGILGTHRSWSWKLFLVVHLALWAGFDYFNYNLLQSYVPSQWPHRRYPFLIWLAIWIGRETLAYPLWLWAMSGRRIEWRGRPFRIRRDLVAEKIVN